MTGGPRADVTRALRALLPASAAAWVWEGDEIPQLVAESEEAAVARAVPARRAEFARGRACARRALSQLGLEPGPIPVGEHRQPVWPPGVVGAITHCDGLVAAAVARSEAVTGLGIDAELARPLPDEARSSILHAGEARPSEPTLEAVVFSAKESIHKTVFPLTGRWLGLLDVCVTLDEAAGSFRAHPAHDAMAEPLLARVEGRFSIVADYVLTVAYCRP